MRAIDAGILICIECHELNRQDIDNPISAAPVVVQRFMLVAPIASSAHGHYC